MKNQTVEPTDSCTLRSMEMATVKTKEDVDFALNWMAKNSNESEKIPFINVRGTVVRWVYFYLLIANLFE